MFGGADAWGKIEALFACTLLIGASNNVVDMRAAMRRNVTGYLQRCRMNLTKEKRRMAIDSPERTKSGDFCMFLGSLIAGDAVDRMVKLLPAKDGLR